MICSQAGMRWASVLLVLAVLALVSSRTANDFYDRTLASVAQQKRPSAQQQQQKQQEQNDQQMPRTIIYSELRGDRSGSVIQDMLAAHAFAFIRNATYGGACPQKKHPFLKRHIDLLRGIGLDEVLPINCPPHMTDVTDMPENTTVIINGTEHSLVSAEAYERKEGGVWHEKFPPEWLKFIRNRTDYTYSGVPTGTKRPSVVIHARRGDVHPCTRLSKRFSDVYRYLPNSHYRRILERHVLPSFHNDTTNMTISIYSEKKSFEPWDDIQSWKMNVKLRLDQDLIETWRAMIGADVLILGGGISGFNAARVAVGMEANVIILERNPDRMRFLDDYFKGRVEVVYSNRDAIERLAPAADLIIGAVLIPGASAPRLVTKDMLKTMKPGTVMVDIAIDQGGCFETSKPTTHENPTYVVDDVVHYCVANMPGGVPLTSALALNYAVLPYALSIADHGWKEALMKSRGLRAGLNICEGQVVHHEVAESLDLPYVAEPEALAA